MPPRPAAVQKVMDEEDPPVSDAIREVAEYSRRGAPPLCAECTALVDALLAPPPPEPGAEPPLRRLFEGTMSQLYERSHIAMLASADQRTAAPLNSEPWYGTRLTR